MFSIRLKLLFLFYFILVLNGTLSVSLQRKIFGEQAPGCVERRNNSCDIPFYYVKAEGKNDTIHYIWDLVKAPSLLISNTLLGNKLLVNWDRYNKGCIRCLSFQKPTNYSFVFIIDKIIEFDDVNDTGVLTEFSKNISYDSSSFQWSIISPFKVDANSDFANTVILGHNFIDNSSLGHPEINGSIILEFNTYGSANYDTELPRLYHSANSTQIRVILKNLTSNSQFQHSRWALNMVIISNDLKNETSTINVRRNLDDENSPGVFSIVDWVTPQASNNLCHGAYMQWRPIVYTSTIASIGNSTDIMAYNPYYVIDPGKTLQCSLAYQYFGSNLDNLLVQRTIVSFGSSQDGFYKKTNYNTWTFLVSYGSPEYESFSLFIILVIAIGLGVPTLLIMLGSIYLCARKCRNNGHGGELAFQ